MDNLLDFYADSLLFVAGTLLWLIIAFVVVAGLVEVYDRLKGNDSDDE